MRSNSHIYISVMTRKRKFCDGYAESMPFIPASRLYRGCLINAHGAIQSVERIRREQDGKRSKLVGLRSRVVALRSVE